MFLSLKTLIPILAIVGAAMGQASNTNSTVPAKSKSSTISENCQKALSSTDLKPECFKTLLNATTPAASRSVCEAPSDGAPGHRCADTQVNKALDTLESSCKSELEKKQTKIWNFYADWLVYPLIRDYGCKKEIDGTYCNHKTYNDSNIKTCQACERSLFEPRLTWKPIRANSFANDIASELAAKAKNTLEMCDEADKKYSSSSTSPTYYISNSAIIGSTAFVAVSAMLLNL
ncbi:hypothetical protein BDF19DRAFT_496000 [Syncephalis fuscata]|nr:hypothetical protein BDF19DRAFT_496000 [Syncephalis fuscata]